MFTGIVETMGQVIELIPDGQNVKFRVQSEISKDLKVDQSLAHDGVCLTVINQQDDWHEVIAVKETLDRSTLGRKEIGDHFNLERAMRFDARLDGHIVQGHVDATAEVIDILDQNGSYEFTFECQASDFKNLVVDKGSICISGVSLTVIQPTRENFRVAIIPYTYEHTSFHQSRIGDVVNLEFDIIGKYIARNLVAWT